MGVALTGHQAPALQQGQHGPRGAWVRANAAGQLLLRDRVPVRQVREQDDWSAVTPYLEKWPPETRCIARYASRRSRGSSRTAFIAVARFGPNSAYTH